MFVDSGTEKVLVLSTLKLDFNKLPWTFVLKKLYSNRAELSINISSNSHIYVA